MGVRHAQQVVADDFGFDDKRRLYQLAIPRRTARVATSVESREHQSDWMLPWFDCIVESDESAFRLQHLAQAWKHSQALVVCEVVQDTDEQDAVKHSEGLERGIIDVEHHELAPATVPLSCRADVPRVVIDADVTRIVQARHDVSRTATDVQHGHASCGTDEVSGQPIATLWSTDAILKCLMDNWDFEQSRPQPHESDPEVLGEEVEDDLCALTRCTGEP